MPALPPPIQYDAERTAQQKLQSVKDDLAIWQAHFKTLATEKGDIKLIAAYALFNYVDRLRKAWNALPTNDSERQYNEQKTLLLRELGIAGYQICSMIYSIKVAPNKQDASRAAPSKPVLLVAGGGPVGWFLAAQAQLKYSDRYRIVLSIDHHGEYPTRGGFIMSVLGPYASMLRLTQEQITQLLPYINFRPQQEESIKHVDMVGRAICQAYGVEIIAGKFSYQSLNMDEESGSARLLETTIGQVKLNRIQFIFNTMGFNAEYPAGVARTTLADSTAPLRHIAVQCQIKVKRDSNLIGLLGEANQNGAPLAGRQMRCADATHDYEKVQIYGFFTPAEMATLNAHLVAHGRQLDKNQQAWFKVQMLIECFVTNDMPWEDCRFRQVLKPGKALTAQYQTSQPSAPNCQLVRLGNSNTLTTWAGAAALPVVTDGQFIQRGCAHAEWLLHSIVGNQFQAREAWLSEHRQHLLESQRIADQEIAKYLNTTPCQKEKLDAVLERLIESKDEKSHEGEAEQAAVFGLESGGSATQERKNVF